MENEQTRKRFEVMCRAVFSKFKACLTVKGINQYRHDYAAISVVYKSLQKDRERADISHIIRQLHQVVDEAIETQPEQAGEETRLYDISQIDFERLRQEFQRSPSKRTTVQNLKTAIEKTAPKAVGAEPAAHRFSAALRGDRGRVQPREGSGGNRKDLRSPAAVDERDG